MRDGPDPIDVHVGQRLRLRRNILGISQQKLGNSVGLTFQQIQKYERGTNRMGASRLYQFCRILKIPVSFFFENIPAECESELNLHLYEMSDVPQAPLDITVDLLTDRITISLVQAFYSIENANVRRRILDMIKAISRGESSLSDKL